MNTLQARQAQQAAQSDALRRATDRAQALPASGPGFALCPVLDLLGQPLGLLLIAPPPDIND